MIYTCFENKKTFLFSIPKKRFIEEGKETGVFRKKINSRLFRNLFVGGFSHLATKWLILENIKAIDMVEQTESFVSLLCCFRARKRQMRLKPHLQWISNSGMYR